MTFLHGAAVLQEDKCRSCKIILRARHEVTQCHSTAFYSSKLVTRTAQIQEVRKKILFFKGVVEGHIINEYAYMVGNRLCDHTCKQTVLKPILRID